MAVRQARTVLKAFKSRARRDGRGEVLILICSRPRRADGRNSLRSGQHVFQVLGGSVWLGSRTASCSHPRHARPLRRGSGLRSSLASGVWLATSSRGPHTASPQTRAQLHPCVAWLWSLGGPLSSSSLKGGRISGGVVHGLAKRASHRPARPFRVTPNPNATLQKLEPAVWCGKGSSPELNVGFRVGESEAWQRSVECANSARGNGCERTTHGMDRTRTLFGRLSLPERLPSP